MFTAPKVKVPFVAGDRKGGLDPNMLLRGAKSKEVEGGAGWGLDHAADKEDEEEDEEDEEGGKETKSGISLSSSVLFISFSDVLVSLGTSAKPGGTSFCSAPDSICRNCI